MIAFPNDLEGAVAPPRANGELVFDQPWQRSTGPPGGPDYYVGQRNDPKSHRSCSLEWRLVQPDKRQGHT